MSFRYKTTFECHNGESSASSTSSGSSASGASGGTPFEWIDFVNPNKTELEALAHEYGLHASSVQDCLDPEHLPKFEKIGAITFIILRTLDDQASHEADTLQDLTRKIAVFMSDKFLITIHRVDEPFLFPIREKWQRFSEKKDNTNNIISSSILFEILNSCFLSFERPIDLGLYEIEKLERQIFQVSSSGTKILEEGYYLKRKAYVIKRILRMSHDVIMKFHAVQFFNATMLQDLKEGLEGINFYADDFFENINTLLNLHISIASNRTNEASHKTNEVMRVLTIFSVFFMPLNFLASIYGMNFEHMPELHFKYAYPALLFFMVFVSLLIYWWFRKRGWLE